MDSGRGGKASALLRKSRSKSIEGKKGRNKVSSLATNPEDAPINPLRETDEANAQIVIRLKAAMGKDDQKTQTKKATQTGWW